MTRLQRRTCLWGAGAALTALTAAAVLPLSEGRAAPTTERATATAPVTRTDLVETTIVDGTLGFDDRRELTARGDGTITALTHEGATVRPGQSLYSLDGRPVTLLSGSVPAYRALSVRTQGEDVRQLEAGLRSLGYSGFRVDEQYTTATAVAVRRWQKALGVPRTGEVELGSVVFGSTPLRIGSHSTEVGDAVTAGTAVLTTTGLRRIVTIDLDVDDRPLVRQGAQVGVELPDGTRVRGRIEQIGSVAEPGDEGADGGSDDAPSEDSDGATVEVVVGLDDAAAAHSARTYDVAPVDVELESARRDDVLSVPVVALLALSEGGYGVRVVDAGTTRTVPVTTGMFARGRVEVQGDGLREGLEVEVPS